MVIWAVSALESDTAVLTKHRCPADDQEQEEDGCLWAPGFPFPMECEVYPRAYSHQAFPLPAKLLMTTLLSGDGADHTLSDLREFFPGLKCSGGKILAPIHS